MDILNQIAFGAIDVVGLDSIYTTVIQKWIGPLLLIAIAVFAIVFIKDRAWMKLVSFVGIAAIVALLIYAGPTLFGNGKGNGVLTKTANNIANKIDPGR